MKSCENLIARPSLGRLAIDRQDPVADLDSFDRRLACLLYDIADPVFAVLVDQRYADLVEFMRIDIADLEPVRHLVTVVDGQAVVLEHIAAKPTDDGFRSAFLPDVVEDFAEQIVPRPTKRWAGSEHADVLQRHIPDRGFGKAQNGTFLLEGIGQHVVVAESDGTFGALPLRMGIPPLAGRAMAYPGIAASAIDHDRIGPTLHQEIGRDQAGILVETNGNGSPFGRKRTRLGQSHGLVRVVQHKIELLQHAGLQPRFDLLREKERADLAIGWLGIIQRFNRVRIHRDGNSAYAEGKGAALVDGQFLVDMLLQPRMGMSHIDVRQKLARAAIRANGVQLDQKLIAFDDHRYGGLRKSRRRRDHAGHRLFGRRAGRKTNETGYQGQFLHLFSQSILPAEPRWRQRLITRLEWTR